MNKLILILAVALLSGCSVLESRQYLHALENDPDCSFQGKPAAYSLPDKCGKFKSYSRGYRATVIRTGPNTFTTYIDR